MFKLKFKSFIDIILKSEKEAIRIITKRLNDRDPHVINNALTVIFKNQ